MTRSAETIPFVKGVLCLTDFSRASERAFEHALAAALRREAWLTLLHAGRHEQETGLDLSSLHRPPQSR